MAIFPNNNNNTIVSTTVPNGLHTQQITNISNTSGIYTQQLSNTTGLWQTNISTKGTSINTKGWKFLNRANIQQIYGKFNIVYNRHKGNYIGINWNEYGLNKASLGLVYFYESEHVRKDDRLFLHCFVETITDRNTDLDGDGVRDIIYESLSDIFFNVTNSTTVEILLRELLENGKPVIPEFFTADTIDSLNPLVYTDEVEYLRICLLMANIIGESNE